jgi:hypothetical protein
MTSRPLPEAIKELKERNLALATAYRDAARRLPPGPVSKLAASMAEQRLDLIESLDEAAATCRSPGIVEFEAEVRYAPEPSAAVDQLALLRTMAKEEALEHELISALAGALLPSSTSAAEQLATEAESARKRAQWAQDQLDLLSMR